MEESEQDIKEILARRVFHGTAIYLSPFRLIDFSGCEPLNYTMEELSSYEWDYVALHRISGGIDIGLPEPYYLLVARDGALFLPRIECTKTDQLMVGVFNRCLSALLLGGTYCEAIGSDCLDIGRIIDWKYIRTSGQSRSLANSLHFALRYKYASSFQYTTLLKPPSVQFTDLKRAMEKGLAILDAIPTLSGEFLLKGITGYSRRDWGTAIANIWIAIEQIIESLWIKHIIDGVKARGDLGKRIDQLRDNRTWSVANKIELLVQTGIIHEENYADLADARKLRNALIHKGSVSDQEGCNSILRSLEVLLSAAVPDLEIPMNNLDLQDLTLTDPFAPVEMRGKPTHWLPIHKLPGEEEIEKLEAQIRKSKVLVEK